MKLSLLNKTEAILITVSCIFTGFLASGMLQMIISRTTESPIWSKVGLIFGEAAMLLPIFYLLRLRRQKLILFIPRQRLTRGKLILVVLFGLGVIMTLDGVGAFLDQFFTIPPWLRDMQTDLLWKSIPELILLIIAGVMVAPVIEELIFRGLLQQAIAGHYQNLLPALVGPAVLFTLFHVQYLLYLPAAFELFLLALSFGWIMGKTGNLWAPIILHAMNNLISLVWLGTGVTATGFVDPAHPSSWSWFALGLLLLLGAGWRLNQEPDFIPFAVTIERRPGFFRDQTD